MSCIPHYHGHSPVHRVDPRARIFVALAWTVVLALGSEAEVLVGGALAALLLVLAAEVPLAKFWGRFHGLNLLMLGLFLVLPLTTPGSTAFSFAGLPVSGAGLLLASRIALRANAIFLVWTALVSTMSPVAFGHALSRLRVPTALVQMLMFTIRYIAVLVEEHQRLLRAMRMRSFAPRFNAHTLRSYGYLVGMLLLRSFERSARVLAAMKCRGYDGRFHMLDNLNFRTSDWAFTAILLVMVCGFGLAEWL